MMHLVLPDTFVQPPGELWVFYDRSSFDPWRRLSHWIVMDRNSGDLDLITSQNCAGTRSNDNGEEVPAYHVKTCGPGFRGTRSAKPNGCKLEVGILCRKLQARFPVGHASLKTVAGYFLVVRASVNTVD